VIVFLVARIVFVFSPALIAAGGLAVTARMRHSRWLIDLLCVPAMLIGGPLLYLWLTMPPPDEAPGPGDGLMFMFLLGPFFVILCCAIAAYAVGRRRGARGEANPKTAAT
jgi:hypothetical protein